MQRGFELLQTRELGEQSSVLSYEKQFNFKLPPLYKLFIDIFITGDNSFKTEYFLNPKRNEKYILNAPLYEPLKDNEKWFLSITKLDEIEKVYNDWNSYLKNEKEWDVFKLLKIADTGQGGGLFVSTQTKDLDVIYQVVWDWDEPYFKVAENIFELVKGFVLPEIKDPLFDGYTVSQLYKNFGEDFWRIRENTN
jgi:hypothetical protein